MSIIALVLSTPVLAESSNDGPAVQDAVQSVEILRGDQGDGEEKEKTPARRGSCAWQCEKFRKECEAYCMSRGRLPGMTSRARDCRADCKQYKSACSRGCKGRSSLSGEMAAASSCS